MLESIFCVAALQVAWKKVRRNKGCAGIDGETITRFARHADQHLATLERTLLAGTYRPMPLRRFVIPKKDGTSRLLGVPTVRDRIVQQALLNALHPLLEPQFEACSFAYRPGRSHKTAIQQVRHWHTRGYEWVLDADIVKYFDNIQHYRLFAEVEERVEPADLVPAQTLFELRSAIFALLEAWVSAGVVTEQGLIFPEKGVPQGAVVSPILANVYLDDFDEQLLAEDLKLVRYADDFVVLTKTEQAALKAQAIVADTLARMDLQLHPDKTQVTSFDRGFRFLGHTFVGDLIVSNRTRKPLALPQVEQDDAYRLVYADPELQPTQVQQAIVAALKAAHQPIPPPLYVALGYGVRPWKRISIATQEWEWKPGMSTLYLVQQGATLQKDQGRFVVRHPATKPDSALQSIEIPIREVERILVFGNVQLSTAAISVCLDEQIPAVFLSQLGDYKGHLWSNEFCDLPSEAAQFGRRQDPDFQLNVAQQIIYGKAQGVTKGSNSL